MSDAEIASSESAVRHTLRLAPVIPVYSPASIDEGVQVALALQRGGLPVIEVTLRTPVALAALAAMVQAAPDAVIGAGTVLDGAQYDAATRAGARFIVSPGATPRLLAAAAANGVPFLPGVQTASELMAGLEAGLDTFKFFPAVPAGGVGMLQAFAGPFPQVRFCPTGGISPATAPDFLALANVLCIGGSWLTPKNLLAAGDWAAVEHLARATATLRR
jgi:2-dehydro-3-deoxyphosphogluconate aldolase/(4S)-4-hydroxy-2-oxoglutarate aldolase